MTPSKTPFSTSAEHESASQAPAAPVTDPFAAPAAGEAQHSGSKHLEVNEAEIPIVGSVPPAGRGQRRGSGGQGGGGQGGGGQGGRGGRGGGQGGGSQGGGGGRKRNHRSRPRG